MSENETPKAPAPEAPKPAAAPPAKAEHAKPAVDLQPWEKEPTAPQWVDAAEDALVQSVRARCGEAIESARSYAGEMTFKVARAAFREVCAVLKNEHAFTLLVDLCGVDFPKRSERFEVVAHLYSFAANRRVRVKTTTDEATAVPSLTPVYKAANWPEREAWDMYGIRFADHPDLTRILLWEGFNGHPLRKDFPIEGIDTGAAIYPEYYDERQGPIAGTGTGWKPKKPEAEKPAAAPAEPPAAS